MGKNKKLIEEYLDQGVSAMTLNPRDTFSSRLKRAKRTFDLNIRTGIPETEARMNAMMEAARGNVQEYASAMLAINDFLEKRTHNQ